jgi:acyl-[acyl-carrier-protein]-phospholipid O-acyltransferase/long-chain-fatty-acid--[acyl-carrier-protein] ligase
VAIGIGCVGAAWACGGRPRTGLVPLGALGLAVAFAALGLAPRSYWTVAWLLIAVGLVSGLYIIPLQAALQSLAPDGERGRFLGTANAMSFLLAAVGAGLFTALRSAGLGSNRVFLVLAGLTAVVGAVLTVWLRRNRARLAAAAT